MERMIQFNVRNQLFADSLIYGVIDDFYQKITCFSKSFFFIHYIRLSMIYLSWQYHNYHGFVLAIPMIPIFAPRKLGMKIMGHAMRIILLVNFLGNIGRFENIINDIMRI